ncbi:ZDHC1 palmitoyltransferase, partial [Corythaeola cristata]|nr:ZDHC1 palmitoyltransferase [Corythaeola cristata]
MNICNKPPNKTAPENLDQAVPEVQVQRARRNGWSWPLHVFQIIAWLMYLFFALVGFGILVPLLPRHWLPAGYIVSFAQEENMDCNKLSPDVFSASCPQPPSLEPRVLADPAAGKEMGHAGEQSQCSQCHLVLSAKSKHCGTCNKCVCGFDHHCKWLNNCVGERNYWLFLNSVLSAILGLGLLLLVACYVFVEFFVDPTMLRSDQHFDALKNHTDHWFVFLPAAPVETRATAILVMAGIFILLSLMTVILLGHLLTFHIYLMWNKLTTYEYILQQRPQQEVKEVDKQLEPCPSQVRPSQVLVILSVPFLKTASLVRSVKLSCPRESAGVSTVCFSFPKLYVHNDEADPEQSSSPDLPSLHFAVPSQRQKKRRKKTRKASSSAMDSSFLLPFFPPLDFPATAAATSSSHSLRLSVPAFPLRAALPPNTIGPIQAAGPPADYRSESAESMDEIPVVQTRLGSTALHKPPKNNSSDAQHCPLSTDNPRGDKKKNLCSGHKIKRKSCQQDRRREQDLELFSKIPAVFVSETSGEPHVSQPQPSEGTSEP